MAPPYIDAVLRQLRASCRQLIFFFFFAAVADIAAKRHDAADFRCCHFRQLPCFFSMPYADAHAAYCIHMPHMPPWNAFIDATSPATTPSPSYAAIIYHVTYQSSTCHAADITTTPPPYAAAVAAISHYATPMPPLLALLHRHHCHVTPSETFTTIRLASFHAHTPFDNAFTITTALFQRVTPRSLSPRHYHFAFDARCPCRCVRCLRHTLSARCHYFSPPC